MEIVTTKAWVYILRCSDNSYYVGCALDLAKRLAQHQAATYNGYTARRRPVELIWFQEYADLGEALRLEQRLKKWSRAKKEAFMAGDFQRLHELAKCHGIQGKPPHPADSNQ
jgi:putative endonuclease